MKIKKIMAAVLVSALGLSMMVGCQKEAKISKAIEIGALNGPTGMGMVDLMENGGENYHISLYQSPDELVGKIVSGEVDIACVPSNMGSVLYQKTKGDVSLLGINTMGVLYIVENGNTITSIEDLKGKTIVASGKGGTPQYVLEDLLQKAGIDPAQDVTIEYLANHTDVVTKVVSEEGSIALLPEPHVTIASQKGENVHIALDLNEEWLAKEGTELPMGIVLAQKSFTTDRKADLDIFLKDYTASVKFVNEKSEEAATLIEKHGILANSKIAQKAIPNCHIVFEEGEEAKASLEALYHVLLNINPQAIGGSLPDEAFYYSK